MGLEAHDEDFGQTLAVWGVPSGPYIMLPIIGPSNARDLMSRPISSFLSGTFAMTDTDVKLALTALDAIETRERYLDFEAIIQGDRYTFVKDAYDQSRDYEISDGESDEDDFLEDLDDFLIED
jgi:phospholipid-binding lipoprotein MlaA